MPKRVPPTSMLVNESLVKQGRKKHLRLTICESCGHKTPCAVITPTLDHSVAYYMCLRCVHNQCRAKQIEA